LKKCCILPYRRKYSAEAFSTQGGETGPDKTGLTRWRAVFQKRGLVAVKPVLKWRGLCSSSSKGNYEVQKERKCLFRKVMLKQQYEEDRLSVTRFGMLRNS